MTKYDRLTKRIGTHTCISGAICPKKTKRGKFCDNTDCKFLTTRECPFLNSLDRLAELEDKIESGELVSKAEYEKPIDKFMKDRERRAVKEFAEKLKEIIHKRDYVVGYAELGLCEEIDELLKEYEK